MKKLYLITIAALFSALSAGAVDITKITQNDWQPLFNGKDLNDWDIHIRYQDYNIDPLKTFRVTDGMLEVNYDNYTDWMAMKEPFGHLGYKKRMFSHYIVAVEYKFHKPQVKNGPGWALQNNGIMIHSQATSELSKVQEFPNSIEVQLLGPTNNLKSPTANVCTPGTHIYDIQVPGGVNQKGKYTQHCTPAKAVPQTFDNAGWARVEVLVLGDSLVKHIVKDDTVVTYKKPSLDNGTSLKKGYIALQGESTPVLFRKVEIVDLVGCTNPAAANYKPFHVLEKNPSDCQVKSGIGFPGKKRPGFQVRRFGDGIHIEFSGCADAEVTILNLAGETMCKHTVSANGGLIRTADWPAGLYTASLRHASRKITRKFLLMD